MTDGFALNHDQKIKITFSLQSAKQNKKYFRKNTESHYKNTPIQIYRKFHLQKLKAFR